MKRTWINVFSVLCVTLKTTLHLLQRRGWNSEWRTRTRCIWNNISEGAGISSESYGCTEHSTPSGRRLPVCFWFLVGVQAWLPTIFLESVGCASYLDFLKNCLFSAIVAWRYAASSMSSHCPYQHLRNDQLVAWRVFQSCYLQRHHVTVNCVYSCMQWTSGIASVHPEVKLKNAGFFSTKNLSFQRSMSETAEIIYDTM